MRKVVSVCLLAAALSVRADEPMLLEARYSRVKGTDPEYAQGAIEKCDVRHAEIAPFVFLIEVPSPADPQEWQQRLNAGVDSTHGAFRVRFATAEEVELVRSGKIHLQR